MPSSTYHITIDGTTIADLDGCPALPLLALAEFVPPHITLDTPTQALVSVITPDDVKMYTCTIKEFLEWYAVYTPTFAIPQNIKEYTTHHSITPLAPSAKLEYLQIRITPALKSKLKALASAQGMTMSEYITHIITIA